MFRVRISFCCERLRKVGLCNVIGRFARSIAGLLANRKLSPRWTGSGPRTAFPPPKCGSEDFCTLATDSGRLMANPASTVAVLLGSLIGGMEATGHEAETKFAKKAQ
jgi:hypothetical protein